MFRKHLKKEVLKSLPDNESHEYRKMSRSQILMLFRSWLDRTSAAIQSPVQRSTNSAMAWSEKEVETLARAMLAFGDESAGVSDAVVEEDFFRELHRRTSGLWQRTPTAIAAYWKQNKVKINATMAEVMREEGNSSETDEEDDSEDNTLLFQEETEIVSWEELDNDAQ